MNILTAWLRHYLPELSVSDRQLADDLTLRGIAVEGVRDLGFSRAGSGASRDGVHNGHLFEMDITTNRVDAMNHYGIAREAATIYGLPLAPLDGALPARAGTADAFPVAVEATDGCGRFTAQILRDVVIAPSTGLPAEYFALLGLKPICNAVDASNFVLQGMGHPTHAFDLDKIEGGIAVRLARKGERLKLLDGTERILNTDDLVVADHAKPLALAGVMGGWDSMITPSTRNIVVESAWFDPASVRRSARRHGLHTDASHRFERGADLNACPVANGLVSTLILGYGGWAEGELIDIVVPQIASRTANRPAIALSVAEVQRHLGATLEDRDGKSALTGDLVRRYLSALGCDFEVASGSSSGNGSAFSVRLPSWRLDLDREIDLIEEVARVYGYNRFANTLPTAMPVVAHPLAAAEAAVRQRLMALGYSEAISSTFASDADGERFGAKGGGVIALENPLSDEARLLRPSLVPGMISMLSHNLNRDVREARLFEQGGIFSGSTQSVVETQSLALGLTGDLRATALANSKDAGFYELKGVLESLVSLFAVSGDALGRSAVDELKLSAALPSWVESGSGAAAMLHGATIASFGELRAEEREARKLRQRVYIAEINLDALYKLPLRCTMAREISRFQAAERDFSFTFAHSVQWRTVAEAVEGLAIAELANVSPLEVFRDAKMAAVPAGHYALLLRCVFQSQERTLREDELAGWTSRVVAALTALGGTIRS